MSDLAQKKCVPCEGGVDPLSPAEAHRYLGDVLGWQLIDDKKIVKVFMFHYFTEAMEFVNKVATLAESEGHHPNIAINYNKVILTLYTHAINGLHENDFILAAKINAL